ncbi:glycosyltransferase family 4 protein [Cytobacillus suaedae]|nr:glycosyltransferase family 4 protein [Cytobacillus suaedae]
MFKKNVNRIWIINHYATGNGDRHDALASQLTKFGVEVLVIASSYNHFTQKYMYQEDYAVEKRSDSLSYLWLRTTPKYTGNGIGRIFNMISFMRMVKKMSPSWIDKYGKPDIVMGSSVHPFTWEAAYWISNKTNADFYTEVRDLWPLSLIEVHGVSSKHPLVILFSYLEKRAYQRAKKIITTMPYANKYITDVLGFSADKIEWIPNSIDTEKVEKALRNKNIKLPSELEDYLTNNWCAVYTGSLVESECIDLILDSAKILQERGNSFIKFAIVGDGHLKKQLLEIAQKQNLGNVKFFDRISKEQVALVVNRSKVCLAAVRNLALYKYGLSMNKLSDYLYSGNPTIFACDVQNVVKSSGGGINLPFGNAELYADSIETVFNMSEEQKRIMAIRGRETIKKQYDTSSLARKLIDIFEDNR